jgi:hypothetical protein
MRILFPSASLSLALLATFLLVGAAHAAEAPKVPVVIKADGAKMAAVTFAHEKHIKVECVKCHHKDADSPKACKTCHDINEEKNKALKIQDSFHKVCQTCHKEQAGKGAKAPTKCNECHKK